MRFAHRALIVLVVIVSAFATSGCASSGSLPLAPGVSQAQSPSQQAKSPDMTCTGCGSTNPIVGPPGEPGGGCTAIATRSTPGLRPDAVQPITPPCGTGQSGGGSSTVSFSGLPKDGQHCAGSQCGIGDPIVPANNNAANATYYVNNISNIYQNGVIVAVEYEAATPASANNYYFIQETNNGATANFGASIGVGFGPVSIGVTGGTTYNLVSPIQWFFPGETPLPKGSTAATCWPAVPVLA